MEIGCNSKSDPPGTCTRVEITSGKESQKLLENPTHIPKLIAKC
jgi:hypothetical protein